MYSISFLLLFLFKFTLQQDNDDNNIPLLIPSEKYNLLNLKLNEELLYSVPIKLLKSNQIYRVFLHFIGPLGIDVKTKIICDDIHLIHKNKNNIRLNDYSEYDFWTNEKGIPKICGDNYHQDKVIISLTPYSLTYQFRDESTIQFNGILELAASPINLGHKCFQILSLRFFYRLFFIFVIGSPLLMLIFRNKLKKFLIWIIDEKLDKEK